MSEEYTCPACCEDIDTDDWSEHWNFVGDSFEVECPHCLQELSVKAIVDVSYIPVD